MRKRLSRLSVKEMERAGRKIQTAETAQTRGAEVKNMNAKRCDMILHDEGLCDSTVGRRRRGTRDVALEFIFSECAYNTILCLCVNVT